MKSFKIKKLYYPISEVSELTGCEDYVLRFWESEFPILSPSKNRSGNRIYTKRDIQTVEVIKWLLKEKKYSIEGARDYLSKQSVSEIYTAISNRVSKEDIKKELHKIKLELNLILNEIQARTFEQIPIS